jgi:carbamoyl-phosphate synthase large subunit
VLEVNPRASRTVPFVSKAIGAPLAKVAARCMAGQSLASQNMTTERIPPYYSVKEAVFPFRKFPGVDPMLGPEMKSTGEVMGVGASFAEAYVKSQIGAGETLPSKGKVFISVRTQDRPQAAELAKGFHDLGFAVLATRGTGQAILDAGTPVTIVNKVTEGRPNIVDMIKNNEVSLIINVVDDKRAVKDSYSIRAEALSRRVAYFTTLAGARAACVGMGHSQELQVYPLQALHQNMQ